MENQDNFETKYKSLMDLWYKWEFSVEWLLFSLPDHLKEKDVNFDDTYRLLIEKRVLNWFDVMYFNANRNPWIIHGLWPNFYWVWQELLYSLADMWIWCRENGYILK